MCIKESLQRSCIFFLFFTLPFIAQGQAILKFEKRRINTDSIPLKNDQGRKRIVVKFVVENIGNKPLRINGVGQISPLGYAEYYYGDASFSKDYIAPNGKDTISLTINLDRYSFPYEHWEDKFVVSSNAANSDTVAITGYNLLFQISEINYQTTIIKEGKKVTLRFLLSNPNKTSVTLDSIRHWGDGLKIEMDTSVPLIIPPSYSCTINAHINTSGLYNQKRTYLRIFYHGSSSKLDYFDYNTLLEGMPDVTIQDSATKTFGTVKQGEIINKSFIVKNNGTIPVTLSSWGKSPCLEIEDTTLLPNKTTLIKITYDTRFDTGYITGGNGFLVAPFKSYNTVQVLVKGKVIRKKDAVQPVFLKFEELEHDFGTVNRDTISNSRLTYEFEFQNVSDYSLSIQARSGDGGSLVSCTKSILQPHERAKIIFTQDVSYRKIFERQIGVSYSVTSACASYTNEINLKVKGKTIGTTEK